VGGGKSIGCILGDEFADGQIRHFKRPGARFNAGQGIFYLDRSFSDVPGIRLQQFNHSPQVEPAPDESNADFIEVVIPFKSCGDLRSGDVVKLAAIVAGGDLNRFSQSQSIDTSLLGTFLSGQGHEKIVLGAVRVKLATAK